MELKTIGLTKKFGSKTAVDNLNINVFVQVYLLFDCLDGRRTYETVE